VRTLDCTKRKRKGKGQEGEKGGENGKRTKGESKKADRKGKIEKENMRWEEE
jgi:hypothetical protein